MAQRYDLDFQELTLNGNNLSITKGNTITLPFANFYLASNPNGYLSSVSFSQILSKPTTIAGYGITDIPTALSYFNNDVSFITSSAYLFAYLFFVLVKMIWIQFKKYLLIIKLQMRALKNYT